MNNYEGMFIFPESIKAEALDEQLGQVKSEIEKSGGQVVNVSRLGKRPFARVMNKEAGGHYLVINFKLEGEKIAALRARYNLNEQLFRVQIVRVKEHTIPTDTAESTEKVSHASA